ncbi:MAG: HEPN domain-containing protein [Deltaproteobacteria bacterium]|nr:HEPN domain-containing protein [Deltaproteobacteria bacterium]
MKEKTLYWLELAEYDLETARVVLAGRRFLYVGFMCHLAAEKTLKAWFYEKTDDTPPYTHNLALLAQKGGLLDLMTEEQQNFIDVLDPLNIEARYPTHKEKLFKSLSEARCLNILSHTEELVSWIKQKLSQK